MTETNRIDRRQWRNLAKEKARSEKRELAYIGQRGTVAEHQQYLSGVSYELAYPNDPKNPQPLKEPLPVIEALPDPVKEPLVAIAPQRKHKPVLANGRNSKRVPSFDKWFCQIFPKDFTYPAWRYLGKTASDVANICRAKAAHAAHTNQKNSAGVPVFDFTVAEAERVFKLTAPTFIKAMHRLIEIGFVECARPGGMIDGNGVKALYRLSDKWKSWEPPERDNSNITKARLALKQNPNKGALSSLTKEALSSGGINTAIYAKGALSSNAYFPV